MKFCIIFLSSYKLPQLRSLHSVSFLPGPHSLRPIRLNWHYISGKISWTDHVRNEEVLLRVNEQRNILHETSKRKANWIGHILRRNCLLQQVIEGKIKRKIEVTRRRGRRRKKLLDGLKDRRGYFQLKEESLYSTMWRNCFGRGFGPVVWQITDDDDDPFLFLLVLLQFCPIQSKKFSSSLLCDVHTGTSKTINVKA